MPAEQTLNCDEGFLGFPEPELAHIDHAKVVIQQCPYEYTSSYVKGSAAGPAAIVNASHFVEFYDEELGIETYKVIGGICSLEPLNFTGLVNSDAIDFIEQTTLGLIKKDKYIVSLGAEHTVTAGLVSAFSKTHKNISVLQIDAHSDLRDRYEGNPYSHASVMARIHEMGLPIVQVGVRAQCKEEVDTIKESAHIHTIYAHQMNEDNSWMDQAIDALSDEVYLTIDTDGLDPSIAPAVGTPEPGGLSWSQLCKLIKKLASRKKIISFDIVELAPRKGDILTQYTMAKLCYKILGYLSTNKQL